MHRKTSSQEVYDCYNEEVPTPPSEADRPS